MNHRREKLGYRMRDIPAFNAKMIEEFAKGEHAKQRTSA